MRSLIPVKSGPYAVGVDDPLRADEREIGVLADRMTAH